MILGSARIDCFSNQIHPTSLMTAKFVVIIIFISVFCFPCGKWFGFLTYWLYTLAFLAEH